MCTATKTTIDAALKVFRSSFSPLIMDNGKDLVHMLCTAYDSPTPAEEDDEEEDSADNYDFSKQQPRLAWRMCMHLQWQRRFAATCMSRTQGWPALCCATQGLLECLATSL